MNKSVLLMSAAAALLMGFGASAQTKTHSTGTFTDDRDGKSYKTVTIGSQTWMAENLNYAAEKSACYDNKDNNCEKYGRLYNWATAKTVCPAGWHLPKDSEWSTLMDNVGAATAGKKFKTKAGWYNNGNGTDELGFSALPGGDGHGDGFYDAGGNGYWWSATERDARRAWYRGLRCDFESVGRGYDYKTGQFSVRCVQD
jgi:uncharacterized protein (TIGR02145 family)